MYFGILLHVLVCTCLYIYHINFTMENATGVIISVCIGGLCEAQLEIKAVIEEFTHKVTLVHLSPKERTRCNISVLKLSR